MREDSMLSDIKKLQAAVNRLEPLETPAPDKGLWADRPTAPVQDQQYFATDATRRIQYFWDVTAANWLSTQLFPLTIANRTTADIPVGTTTFAAVLPREHRTGGVYLTGLDTGFTARTVQSGAVFYTLTGVYSYHQNSPANVNLAFTTTPLDTKLFTTINLNNEMATDMAQVVPAGAFRISLVMTVTGAAGAFLFEATASYRLVG